MITGMRMNLLLTLMLMAAFSTAMSAQDMEQTTAPILEGYSDVQYWHSEQQADYIDYIITMFQFVVVTNADEIDGTIYYRRDKGYGPSEWEEYTGNPIPGSGLGETTVEVYAVADGKLPSDVVYGTASILDDVLYAACIVDGLQYYLDYGYTAAPWYEEMPSSDVYVCCSGESGLSSQPYTGDIIIPSELVFRDETYTVAGLRPAAFACTVDFPCDITSVELPGTVVQVGGSSFAGCINLKRMTIHAVTPPDAGYLFSDDYVGFYWNDQYAQVGFDGNTLYDQVTLFVPSESVEEYRAHEEWGKFTHIVPFIGAGPGDINGDGNIAINDVTNIIDQLLGGEEIPAYCDVDGDGNVSIKDVTALIDQLLSGN